MNGSGPVACGTPHPADETLHQKAKRMHSAAISAGAAKNTADKYARRSQRVRSRVSSASAVTNAHYDSKIAKVVIDWACDHIPEELWEPVTLTDGTDIFAVSSSGNTFISHQYTSEPKHHVEAMGRASERAEWVASEKRELDALEELEFARIVDIPPDRILLPVIWVYKYKTDEFNNHVLFKAD